MRSSMALWATRFLLVLFGLMASTVVLAQSTGGRVLGRVADPSGAVLAGVKVTLTNEATGVTRLAQTSASGDYVFVEVPPRKLSRGVRARRLQEECAERGDG